MEESRERRPHWDDALVNGVSEIIDEFGPVTWDDLYKAIAFIEDWIEQHPGRRVT